MSTTETNTPRRLRIGLLWHSLSSGNLGVRALTVSQIRMLEQIAEAEDLHLTIKLFGNAGSGPQATRIDSPRIEVLPDVQPIGLKPWHPNFRAYLREVGQCALVLDIGEGDSFTDIYGMSRYLKQVFSRLKVIARGRPLVIAPQTIGPFTPGPRERLPGLIMKRAKIACVRDEQSLAYARKISGGRDILCATDLAMALPYDTPEATGGDRPRVGINVSGLLYGRDEGSAGFGITLDYRAMIHTLIERFMAEHDAEVVIVDHVIVNGRGDDDDVVASTQLAERYPGIGVATNFDGPSEAKSFIAGLDFFTGARMHACIAAFSSLTPHVPMAYSRKATGLFQSLGYDEVVDLKAETDADVVAEKVLAGFRRREELRAGSEAGMAEARRRLAPFEAALRDEVVAAAGRA